jgi:hypothetical protein
VGRESFRFLMLSCRKRSNPPGLLRCLPDPCAPTPNGGGHLLEAIAYDHKESLPPDSPKPLTLADSMILHSVPKGFISLLLRSWSFHWLRCSLPLRVPRLRKRLVNQGFGIEQGAVTFLPKIHWLKVEKSCMAYEPPPDVRLSNSCTCFYLRLRDMGVLSLSSSLDR